MTSFGICTSPIEYSVPPVELGQWPRRTDWLGFNCIVFVVPIASRQ